MIACDVSPVAMSVFVFMSKLVFAFVFVYLVFPVLPGFSVNDRPHQPSLYLHFVF